MKKIKALLSFLLFLIVAGVFVIGVVATLYIRDKGDNQETKEEIENIVTQDNDKDKTQLEKTLEKVVNPDTPDQKQEKTVVSVVQNSMPSVVSVVSDRVVNFENFSTGDPFFDQFFNVPKQQPNSPQRQESSIGTGFFVQGGYVFTNKHVVDDKDSKYKIVLNDGKTSYDVDQVFTDPLQDFAILKLENKAKNAKIPTLKLADSEKILIGQTVLAIGNALGEFSNTVSKGIISGINRQIVAGGGLTSSELLDNVIQIDAALNSGNSGGPLINLDGEVIGINVAVAGSGENIGFSIPINAIKSVFESFKKTGKLERPFLGISYGNNFSIAQQCDLVSKENEVVDGAIVLEVVPDSSAEGAGLQRCDLITKIDDKLLTDKLTLAKVIRVKGVNDEISIDIVRDGKKISLKALLKAAE